MRRLPALVAAPLILAAQPFLVGTAASTSTLLLAQSSAQAQSAEAVAKVAQSITVRIEGATQGSGVLVKRDGNRYTVLTAWHVVSGQRPGEELEIFTPDGQRHQLEQGSIIQVGEVDIAVLTFTSASFYEVARIGDVKSFSSGSTIWVSGYPLPTSAVQAPIWRFLKGDVIAHSTVAISNGYQLLYSNPTLPGMSGGAVLNDQGQLVGIHGQGETDFKMSEQQGIAVKTGTNQAVPIAYYLSFRQPQNLARIQRSDQNWPSRLDQSAWLDQGAYQPTYSDIERIKATQLARRAAWDSMASDQQQKTAQVYFGDTLVKIAARYNLTLSELLRLNPGLETARLVVGGQIVVSDSISRPSRMVLGLNPTTSGGIRWPGWPDLPSPSVSGNFQAWSISGDGILRLRTGLNLQPKAFYEEGRGSAGPRIWIDLLGGTPILRTVNGSGAISEVRFNSPSKNVVRMTIQLRAGVRLDATKIRLVGVSNDRWEMLTGLKTGLNKPLGEGSF